MSRLAVLPQIMVAPNGARKTKADHPALPITIGETVAVANAAYQQGAGALHAHVRDKTGAHILDAGFYRELIAEMSVKVPEMPVQITTESVGQYSPAQQRALVEEVKPEGVSVALREICPGVSNDGAAIDFFNWAEEAGVAVQHILYDANDAARLIQIAAKHDQRNRLRCLFVLGAYLPARPGAPADLVPFLDAISGVQPSPDWAACAFGRNELSCLVATKSAGGKCRIGFENNHHLEDGHLAESNAEQVRRLVSRI